MSKPLRILHLEDDSDYSDLVKSLLEAAGVEVALVRVGSRGEFEAALEPGRFDIVLADYLLPGYDGVQALRFAQEKCPQTPFILVSGTIGEVAAIESLKAGATDYVLKHWPERLVPAVRRVVQEVQERTERRRAETELVRREKYFRALSENSLDIISILNRDGVILYNSSSLTRVLGYRPVDLAGQSGFARVHPDDLANVLENFEKIVTKPDGTGRVEFRYRHQDDSWRYLEAVGQNRLEDPDIAGVVVNSRDVTDRKQAEASLLESEQRFRDLFEGSPDAIFVEDGAGIVLDANPAACRLHGFTREELVGRNAAELVPPEARERVERGFQSLVEGEPRQFEGDSWTRDGRRVPVEVRVNRIDYGGKRAVLLQVRDITERKGTEAALRCLEDQLRQSQKMEAIGQLAGGVAHDFNNILTVIQGHASLLLAGRDRPGDFAYSARQICEAAQRATVLTRQLLTFSRRQLMQLKRLDMNEVVNHMTRMLERILGEDIALQLHYSPEPAPVQADAGMIEQVLLNLAVNSRDAMPRGGVLTIRIALVDKDGQHGAQPVKARGGRCVCLSVSDTGCGIGQDDLPRIFEPFYTTKEVGKGTGLGLATVYGIVQQHRGWIETESEIGKGTVFKVYLPCSTGAAELPEARPAEGAVRGGTETILVVEDDAPVRELVCARLAEKGYHILQAESGVAALEIWKTCKEQVDLLLTDMVMPDRMNGRELAERLLTERPQLKVILTSGYSNDEVCKDFVLRRGLNYLQKPYPPQKLAVAVRDCLDAPD
jgi:two-component system cell cycle sensor histidine kinase/response regulator CckA